ncbi:MAG: type IV toxin-antitoxin system AbiEi family antitoxin domain-containing protein [Solirubrobacterales bacterium]
MGGRGLSRGSTAGADAALAALARRQHGVVSIRQLRQKLGFSMRMVEGREKAGRLHRLHPGVYAVGHVDLSLHGRCLAAVLASGRGALLSHYSASWLWGLSKHKPAPFHVTVAQPRRRRAPIRLHYARNLTVEDRDLRKGIPVTSVARVLLDLAAGTRADGLRRLIKRAEELKKFDLGAVDEVLARNRGHRGARPLRRALAGYRPPAFTRSETERRLLDLLEGAGLPRPATGYNECGHELDFYWPQLRFAIELDLFETHGTRESFESDRLRQEELKLAGVEMTRVTGRRLEREPRQVLDRVARLLAQRRRDLALLEGR